jgi:mRNA-degrading endonuclease HigB of HigAB toxin-antitoxin module
MQAKGAAACKPAARGVKAARSQYEEWLQIARRAQWRNPEDVKAACPKASILNSSCSDPTIAILHIGGLLVIFN